MKRIQIDDYFGDMIEVLGVIALCIPYAFFGGWIIYGVTWRILRALNKPYPDHLFWRIMLVLGAILAAVVVICFFYCLFLLIKELFRRAAIRRRCKKKGHDWDARLHCRRCGEVKPHEHEWSGCRCTLCGELRDAEHDWNGCKCRICGKVRNEGHEWKKEFCPNCGGSGHVTHYGDWGDDYEEPCGCAHPVEWVCATCGKRRDASAEE